jgi:hypothetical protein
MNRVMKVAVNWKPQSTPELIQKLYDIVDFQFINLCSALHSISEYELTSSYKNVCCCWYGLEDKLEAPKSLYSSPGYNNNISQ